MRKIISINQEWKFEKGTDVIPAALPAGWATVDLPHTWNAVDGMDGGADYYREPAVMRRFLILPNCRKQTVIFWKSMVQIPQQMCL